MYVDAIAPPPPGRHTARSLVAEMGTQGLAARLSVSVRTVQRWITTASQVRCPSPARAAMMAFWAARHHIPRPPWHAPAIASVARGLRWPGARARRLRDLEADLTRERARLEVLFAGLCDMYRVAGLPAPASSLTGT